VRLPGYPEQSQRGLGTTPGIYVGMRSFFMAYRHAGDFVQQPVAQIPWGHNLALMRKLEDADERAWYATQTVEHGWSRCSAGHLASR
jgi:hypothetical protein